MLLLQINLETIEMLANNAPDILVDFIQTENVLGTDWRKIAIRVACRILPPALVMSMLLNMISHPLPEIRELVVLKLFNFWTLEEISVHLAWSQKRRI